ncbi:hypothetical protein [Sphingomonas sp.]|uniref:hypothetical protein n=1 Tax=Sphingomonas sp. TaxID=28214 RepID=UPI0035C807F9
MRGLTGGMMLVLAAPAAAQTLPDPTTPAPGTPPPPQPAGAPDRVTGRRTYDAEYFKQFAPNTALQIVERVPGFSIEQVDETVRGFGQSAGNVVINGQRPSSKSDTVETILARIPASRVLRVEVGTGDLFAAEYTGKSQVLNLVLTTDAGTSTTLEGSVLRDFTGKLFPEGSISALVRRGPSTFNAALTIDNESTSEEGFDRVTTLPGRVETEYRDKFNRIADPNAALSAAWEYNGGTNRTAHLNLRAFRDRFALTQTNHVTRPDAPPRDDYLTQRYDTDQVELGGDVTRPLAGGGLKLIGLATRRFRDNRDVSLIGTAGEGFTQRLEDTLEETLARLVWNRGGWNGWNVEAGVEGVINRLDSRNQLFDLIPGRGAVQIDLPVDQAVVKEIRGEAFLNAGRALSPNLRLDGSLTFEMSRITVTGDAEAERTLKFLKPKLVVDWRPGADWHAQLSLQRTVAQLQFEDFIGSAELASDRVNSGTANLLPQRAWEALATIERPILGQGLARVELGYTLTQKVQDRVPTPEGFDAPGNLGTGRTLIARGRVEAPLSRVGFKGGRLILYGSYVGTSVEDPYTRRDRPFSGNSAFLGEATLRQDLTHFAWGFTVEGSTPSTFYRLNETDRNFGGFPYLTAFVEWRPAPATTVTFTLENIASTAGTRERLFYQPDRRTPEPYLREYRWRTRHLLPSITFKKTFG